MSNNKDFKVRNGISLGGPLEESLGSLTYAKNGWYIAPATYNDVTIPLTNVGGTEACIRIVEDGATMYIGSDAFYKYTLSTPWDISTATYNTLYSFGGHYSDIFFKPDGTVVYTLDRTGAIVRRWNLGTAWDLSTVGGSAASSFSVLGQEASPWSFHFNSDGTKMYICGSGSDSVHEYTLGTAWDISTASITNSFSIASVSLEPKYITVSDDGLLLFVGTNTSSNSIVYQFAFGTAYDASTLTYSNISFDATSILTTPLPMRGMTFRDDGTDLYIIQFGNAFQFSSFSSYVTIDAASGSYVEFTPVAPLTNVEITGHPDTGYVNNTLMKCNGKFFGNIYYPPAAFVSSTSAITYPYGHITEDGYTLFLASGTTTAQLYKYSLGTAWEASTAVLVTGQTYSSTLFQYPRGISVSPDGTKMAVAGNSTPIGVNYLTMSTPFDLTTATFVGTPIGLGASTQPNGVAYSADGTKFYVQVEGERLYQYTLLVPWDLTSNLGAVIYDFGALSGAWNGIVFSKDGRYLIQQETGVLYRHTLQTPWDILTLDISSQITGPFSGVEDLHGVSPDGKKLIAGSGTTLYTFNIFDGVDATVNYDPSINFAGGAAPSYPIDNRTDLISFRTKDGGTTYQATLVATDS